MTLLPTPPNDPTDAAGWHASALAFAAEQKMPEATRAFERAAALAPNDFAIAVGQAVTCFASGLPAAQLFRHARDLAPGNPEITLRTAVALASEGNTADAEALLVATLDAHPEWVEGHNCLAKIRWAAGRASEFIQSFRDACRLRPRDLWPEELGLSLPAYQQIEPVRGRLVLFPSTMWHSTAPFTEGERLVIAFDVGAPRS